MNRRLVAPLSWMVLALLAAACTAPAAQPAAREPAAGQPKDLGTVRVAVPHRVFFDVSAPLYVGEEKGIFQAEGLKLDPTFTAGGAANLQGALTGEIDIVIGSGTSGVYQAFSRNAPLRIISAQMTGTPDVIWYAQRDSPVNGLRDLNGRKVAFSNRGSSTHLMVLTMNDILKQQGGTGVEEVPTGSPPDTYTAVRTNQVDAGWTALPFFLDEVEKGNLKIVVRGSELTPLKDLTVRVFVANSDFAQRNPEAVSAFLRGWQRSLDYITAYRAEGIGIWKRRAELQEPDQLLNGVLDFYSRDNVQVGPVKGIEENNRLAVQFGLLDQPLTQQQLDTLITTQFLPKQTGGTEYGY